MKKDLDINKFIKEEVLKILEDKALLPVLYSRIEESLLKKYKNKRVIDYLLENYKSLKIDINPLVKYSVRFSQRDILDSIINHNLLNKLYKEVDIEELINNKIEGKSVYKIIYEYYKSNRNFKCSIPKEVLLYEIKGKTILEYLIHNNSDINIKQYLFPETINDLEIATILLLNGAKFSNRAIPLNAVQPLNPLDNKALSNYIEDIQNELYSNKILKRPISPYQDQLLNSFRKLMLEDKHSISDERLINTIIEKFKRDFQLQKPYAEKTLELLIKIKEECPIFKVISSKNETEYKAGFYVLKIKETDIYNLDSINHEIIHLIHHYYDNYKVPEEFIEIKEKIKNELTFSQNIKKYINWLNDNREEYKNSNKILLTMIINSQNDYIESAKQFRKDFKYLLKKHSKKYPQARIEDIYINNFSEEEYIANMKIKTFNQMNSILRDIMFSNDNSITDILDAITNGVLFDNQKGIKGHGSDYYKNENKVFREILANYITIINSPNSQKEIAKLKLLVGEELIDLLNNYYESIISNKKKKIK